jgi:hypothetical protein
MANCIDDDRTIWTDEEYEFEDELGWGTDRE